jgi:hypothetical protein
MKTWLVASALFERGRMTDRAFLSLLFGCFAVTTLLAIWLVLG